LDAKSIIGDITAVTKKWTQQRKAEERRASAASRRPYLYRRLRYTAIQAAWEIMPVAYAKVSDNGLLPAHARQMMYASRDYIQHQTGDVLNDKYFTQTLLPDYMAEHASETASWDVVFDARGHFLEPHTGLRVPLGTLQVRSYLAGSRKEVTIAARGLFPTRGPANRFAAVLFIEKEGFLPLFHRVQLAERYDLAIMSTKGMSVVAARRLVDEVCGGHGIPLFVLHDFDCAGFSILGTLHLDNRRYCFRHRDVRVIDLGLRLADVEACGLKSEYAHVPDSTRKVEATLRRNGARSEEVNFLLGRKRVELNAFTSRALVDWLEAKLKEHGVKKVVPGADVLAEAYRRVYEREFVRTAIPHLTEIARRQLGVGGIPDDLLDRVKALLAKDTGMPWDHAVARVARAAVRREKGDGPTGENSPR
jgi:hypothetical protein